MNTRKVPFRLPPALICLSAVLWLVMACGDPYPGASCPDSMAAAIKSEGASSVGPSRRRDDRHAAILDKYSPLIEAYPNYRTSAIGLIFDDGKGGPAAGPTGAGSVDEVRAQVIDMGIHVGLTAKVDRSTVPLEKRIPNCLDGVPVLIYVDTSKPVLLINIGKTKLESTEGGRRVSVLKRQEGAPVNLG